MCQDNKTGRNLCGRTIRMEMSSRCGEILLMQQLDT